MKQDIKSRLAYIGSSLFKIIFLAVLLTIKYGFIDFHLYLELFFSFLFIFKFVQSIYSREVGYWVFFLAISFYNLRNSSGKNRWHAFFFITLCNLLLLKVLLKVVNKNIKDNLLDFNCVWYINKRSNNSNFYNSSTHSIFIIQKIF